MTQRGLSGTRISKKSEDGPESIKNLFTQGIAENLSDMEKGFNLK